MRFLTENVDGHVPENGGTCHLAVCANCWPLWHFRWKDSMRTFLGGMNLLWRQFVTWIWGTVFSWWSGRLGVRLAWLKRYLIPYSVIQWNPIDSLCRMNKVHSLSSTIEIRLLCMHSVCLSKIWSFLVISLWNGGLEVRLAWLQRYFSVYELSSIYSHCRNDQLRFVVDHSIEIRLLWEIGGIWLKWCRERSELVRASMIFAWCFPSGEILRFHFRSLTFSSVCSVIRQSNSMRGLYF
jgi:hypothetical protein